MPPVECRITRQKKIKNKLKQEAIRMIRNLHRVHYLTIYFDHIQKTRWDNAFLIPIRYFRHKALETTVLKRVSNTEHRG